MSSLCAFQTSHKEIETVDQFQTTHTTQSMYLPLSVKNFTMVLPWWTQYLTDSTSFTVNS